MCSEMCNFYTLHTLSTQFFGYKTLKCLKIKRYVCNSYWKYTLQTPKKLLSWFTCRSNTLFLECSGHQNTKNSFFCFFYQKIFFYVNIVNRKVVHLPKTYKIDIEVFFLWLSVSSLGKIFRVILKSGTSLQIIYESNILNSIWS